MTQDASNVMKGALRLSASDRAELAAELIESLDDASDDDAVEAWDAEVMRRIDDLDAGKAQTLPWSVVRKRIMGT